MVDPVKCLRHININSVNWSIVYSLEERPKHILGTEGNWRLDLPRTKPMLWGIDFREEKELVNNNSRKHISQDRKDCYWAIVFMLEGSPDFMYWCDVSNLQWLREINTLLQRFIKIKCSQGFSKKRNEVYGIGEPKILSKSPLLGIQMFQLEHNFLPETLTGLMQSEVWLWWLTVEWFGGENTELKKVGVQGPV